MLRDAAAAILPVALHRPAARRARGGARRSAGREAVAAADASTIIVSDSAQYYTGRAFGRRPLSPAISPKKTLEGAIGGLLFGTAGDGARRPVGVPGDAPSLMLVLVGARVSALGIVGDLFESLLKRSAGVKDSSH